MKPAKTQHLVLGPRAPSEPRNADGEPRRTPSALLPRATTRLLYLAVVAAMLLAASGCTLRAGLAVEVLNPINRKIPGGVAPAPCPATSPSPTPAPVRIEEPAIVPPDVRW